MFFKLNFFRIIINILLFIKLSSCIDVECKSLPETFYEDIDLCCKEPTQNEVTLKCAEKYSIPIHNEEIRFSEANIENNMCFAECVIIEGKFLDEDKLDMKNVKEFFDKYHSNDTLYVNEMIKSIEKCYPEALESLEAIKKHKTPDALLNGKCKPFPGFLMECASNLLFINCPENLWTSSKNCEETKKFIQSCS